MTQMICLIFLLSPEVIKQPDDLMAKYVKSVDQHRERMRKELADDIGYIGNIVQLEDPARSKLRLALKGVISDLFRPARAALRGVESEVEPEDIRQLIRRSNSAIQLLPNRYDVLRNPLWKKTIAGVLDADQVDRVSKSRQSRAIDRFVGWVEQLKLQGPQKEALRSHIEKTAKLDEFVCYADPLAFWDEQTIRYLVDQLTDVQRKEMESLATILINGLNMAKPDTVVPSGHSRLVGLVISQTQADAFGYECANSNGLIFNSAVIDALRVRETSLGFVHYFESRLSPTPPRTEMNIQLYHRPSFKRLLVIKGKEVRADNGVRNE